MAGRVQQDSFIDDADSCPLCVEELDLSDRNFRPCPCGYQVCQFCFNNIKNNMNGLCPACRRPYDDKTIEWKVISPEEFKADLQKQARKRAENRQKEAQKREAESLNRKHLAGLRVVQKNLVYVVGLNPRIREEDLLTTLRGPQYFGQYGKIVKIVVSKSKDSGNKGQSLGVHVTFASKEDAEKCIAAVDGSENGGRTLRAQFGTTKYCAAYLRHETCANKNCMFLHEPGEEKDSFTRQDLSSINAAETQRPAQGSTNPPTSSRQTPQNAPHSQAPLQQAPRAAAIQSQVMARDASRDTSSPVDLGDGSALPSSASWATRGVQGQQNSRRGSRAPSASTPSPQVENATVVARRHETVAPGDRVEQQTTKPIASSSAVESEHRPTPSSTQPKSESPPPSIALLERLLKSISSPDFKFAFAPGDELDSLLSYPCLLANDGGVKFAAIQAGQAHLRRETVSRKVAQAMGRAEAEAALEAGSLQLGGEPEGGRGESAVIMESTDAANSGQHHQQLPTQAQHPLAGIGTPDSAFGPSYSGINALSSLAMNGRGPPSAQHQLLMKSTNTPTGNAFDQYSGVVGGPQQGSMENFRQTQQPLTGAIQQRQGPRYAFGNETVLAAATAKQTTTARYIGQQPSMMSNPGAAHLAHLAQPQSQQQQLLGNQNYAPTSIPAPPPGLKSTAGTPVTGAGLFGHGSGFGGAGPNLGNMGHTDDRSDMLRDMLRTRGATEAGKHESELPALDDVSTAVDALVSEEGQKPSPANALRDAGVSDQLPFALPSKDEEQKPASTANEAAAKIITSSQAVVQDAITRPPSRAITPALPVIPVKPADISASPQRSDKSTQKTDTVNKELSHDSTQPKVDSGVLSGPAVPTTTSSTKDEPKKTEAVAAMEPPNQSTPAAPTTSPSKAGANTAEKSKEGSIKRSPPGKLDIMAATRDLIRETQALSAPGGNKSTGHRKGPQASSGVDLSSRPIPAKTLRVVPTSKATTPKAEAQSLPTTATTAAPPATKSLSGKGSSSAQPPATPASEFVSEQASLASASISRTSSPPPAKGDLSRSARKKQRREANKEQKSKEEKKGGEKKDKEVEPVSVSATPAEEIAPIIGRKKKKPKPRPVTTDDDVIMKEESVPKEVEKKDMKKSVEAETKKVEPKVEEVKKVHAKEAEKKAEATVEKKTGPKLEKSSEKIAAEVKPEEKPAEVKSEKKAQESRTSSSAGRTTSGGGRPKASVGVTDTEVDENDDDFYPHLTPARILTGLVAKGEIDTSKHSFFNPNLVREDMPSLEQTLADLDARINKAMPQFGGNGGVTQQQENTRAKKTGENLSSQPPTTTSTTGGSSSTTRDEGAKGGREQSQDKRVASRDSFREWLHAQEGTAGMILKGLVEEGGPMNEQDVDEEEEYLAFERRVMEMDPEEFRERFIAGNTNVAATIDTNSTATTTAATATTSAHTNMNLEHDPFMGLPEASPPMFQRAIPASTSGGGINSIPPHELRLDVARGKGRGYDLFMQESQSAASTALKALLRGEPRQSQNTGPSSSAASAALQALLTSRLPYQPGTKPDKSLLTIAAAINTSGTGGGQGTSLGGGISGNAYRGSSSSSIPTTTTIGAGVSTTTTTGTFNVSNNNNNNNTSVKTDANGNAIPTIEELIRKGPTNGNFNTDNENNDNDTSSSETPTARRVRLAEAALAQHIKEGEALEKKFNELVASNRKLCGLD